MDTVAELQSYLAAQGIVDGSSGWTSYRRFMRDLPNQVVVLSDDGGPGPEMKAATGLGEDASQFEGVQVRTRGAPGDGDGAKAKAIEIRDAIHSLTATTLGSTIYEGVWALTSAPVFIGPDDNDRPEFTQSFRFMSPVPA